MYANEEDVPLISSSKVPIKKKGIARKFVLGSIALSAIALLVVSLNGGMSKSTSSSAIAAALSEKRVKMSKEGTLHYTSLNEGEKKQLFAEFVGNYEKKVSRISDSRF
jgi:Mrp family chromosome partitioning ATPase